MIIERIWPQWKAEKEIGRGSYGVVYKCSRDNNGIKEYAAIKVIFLDPTKDPSFTGSSSGNPSRRFFDDIIKEIQGEAELLSSLSGNPNIVEIKESASLKTEEGFYLLLRMELLESLERYIAGNETDEAIVKKLGTDLCEALKVCHEKGIIHRDIKPKNILVDSDVNFKLGDFGVAKKLEGRGYASSLKGNFEFMAPEVIQKQKSDARSDIYSLGLVLYWLLNDRTLPFVPKGGITRYSDYQKALERRMAGEELPAIEGVSEELNRVILKACQYKPENRYRSAKEFQEALKGHEPLPPFPWKPLAIITAIILAVAISSFVGYKIYDYISIDGIKLHLGNEYINPNPLEISEYRLIGNWGYFIYSMDDKDVFIEPEGPYWDAQDHQYPELFRYSRKDRIAERVSTLACYSYQVADDDVYFIDGSPGWGTLYALRQDKRLAERMKMFSDYGSGPEYITFFRIVANKYIYYSSGNDGDFHIVSLYRMNLDGSERMICAYPVDVIIDGRRVSMEANQYVDNFRDGWIDCGSFKLELAFPATGEEQIVVQDATDNDWVYYIANNILMKIRKDGSEQTILDGNQYFDNGTEFYYYSLDRIEDDWIYYNKGGIDFRIKTDGTNFEKLGENY